MKGDSCEKNGGTTEIGNLKVTQNQLCIQCPQKSLYKL